MVMIVVENNGNAKYLTFTLTEKQTVNSTSFIFEFIHTTTKQLISFVINATDDVSTNKNRYNEFELGTRFNDATTGQYKYVVKCGSTNDILEQGSCVVAGIEVERKQVDNTLEVKAYNG